MSVRERARIVGAVAKSRKELKGLDNRVKEAENALNTAQNTLLRLQQVRDRTQDRLDEALNFYDALEEVGHG
jgi:hypothetical protein